MPLTVRHVHGTDGFVALPAHACEALLATQPALPLVLQLTSESGVAGAPEPKAWFVAWAGAATSGAHLEVASALGECIGLGDGWAVRARARVHVPAALRVCVDPADPDDWEAAALHAGDVEEMLLQQACVAAVGQCLPFWPAGRGRPLRLRVTSADPAPVVRLVNDTQLVVAPLLRQRESTARDDDDNGDSNAFTPLPSVFRIHPATPPNNPPTAAGATMPRLQVHAPAMVAYIHADALADAGLAPGALARLSLVSGGLTHDPDEPGAPPPPPRLPNGALVRLLPADGALRLPAAAAGAHVALPRHAREALTAPLCARLRLEVLDGDEVDDVGAPRRITLCPLQSVEATRPEAQLMHGAMGFAQRSLATAAAGALSGMHLAALRGAGWDGRLAAQPPAGPTPAPAGPPAAASAAPAPGEACDAAEAARRLFGAWLAAQVPLSPGGVPLLDGTLITFTLAGDARDGALGALGAFGAREATARASTASFVLRTDPSECLLRPAVALRALSTLPVSLGPPMPRPFAKEGAEGTPWPPADAHLPRRSARLAADARAADAPALAQLPWAAAVPTAALQRLRSLLSGPQRRALRALGAPAPGGVILHGPPGVGRTALALAVASALASDPDCAAFVVSVSCAELAGEEPDGQRQALEAALCCARGRRPALILLDDIDALCPAPETDLPSQPGSAADAQLPLAEFLADAMDALQPGGGAGPQPIAFLATSTSPTALAPQLRASGRLDLALEVPPPSAAARETLIVAAADRGGRLRAGVAAGAAADAAAATEGYDLADLAVLAERSVIAAAGRLLAPAIQVPLPTRTPPPPTPPQTPLAAPDFAAGRAGLLPASLRGAGVTAAASTDGDQGTAGWASVGGLADVRGALEDALQLPAMHAALFASAPLRLRTGALLYGPPGCGKTLIARAAASAAGLRLIGVKGPELLNKYIGQSEAGVRALFRKAAAAAPCVLFFDEFDAIAPRRGHDNTGVTDRVVNQLLTELDGIEALHGVAVIAATSRPDLLDPALLRPGRLDRMLHCNLPDAASRRHILAALAPQSGLRCEGEMIGALDAAAASTQGCSGADLAALLSEAQLAAAKDALAAAEAQGEHVAAQAAVVTAAHVRAAALTTRPSVSVDELARLDAIYAGFIAGRAGGLGDGGARKASRGKRATLA